MAEAIAAGIVHKEMLLSNQIIVFDVSPERMKLAQSLGFVVSESSQSVADQSEYVLLAVKPQSVSGLLEDTKFSNNILISIIAGIGKEYLERATDCKVARVMPNMSVIIGMGVSAADCNGLSSEQKEFVLKIFASVGSVITVDELHMDAVTAVSGSGPAYVYMFIDAIAKAGARRGLPEDISKELAVQTFIGAASLAHSSSEPLEALIEKVCSKGGTTVEAVKEFQTGGLYELCDAAVEACYRRSKELSK